MDESTEAALGFHIFNESVDASVTNAEAFSQTSRKIPPEHRTELVHRRPLLRFWGFHINLAQNQAKVPFTRC